MLTIDKNVHALYPKAKVGILVLNGAAPAVPVDEAVARDAMTEIVRWYADMDRATLKSLSPIRFYCDYYRRFGYSYHVLGQLESVLKGKKQLHAESGLLQSMFITEMESMLLTAGHDLRNLQTPLRLTVAAGGEPYVSITGNETTCVSGDLMICDGSGVISSILRGPDHRTRITGATTDVLFTLYAPPGIEDAQILPAMETLAARVHKCLPDSNTSYLDVFTAD
jgi:DNA/RNA-binding domain of Phe-tRNA-synthetase-like protein